MAAIAPILAACGGAPRRSRPWHRHPSRRRPRLSAPSVAASVAPSVEPTPIPSPEAELNVYNWDAYIGEDTQKKFTDATGIKVHYDKFDTAETMLAKIRSDGKGAGFDICYPTSTDIPALVSEGVVQPLTQSLIPNSVNLGAQWQNPGYDPGNQHSMPYMWWTTGFCWDGAKIKAS